jgi:hypothetical protein
MSQIQVFQCPACGANLHYDGGPEISFACQFCGTSVIVPEELRSKSNGAAPMPPGTLGPSRLSGSESPGDIETGIKKILGDLVSIDDPDIQELLGMELSEAISKAMRAGGGARAAQLAELLRLAPSSRLEAVKVFRQIYPTVSANDALLAVTILGGGSPGQPGANRRRR